MEICIEDKAFSEEGILFRQGFLDLDHHIDERPDVGGIVDKGSSCFHIFIVRKTRTYTGALLHIDMVARCDISSYIVRGETHTELIVLDLLYASDLHSLDILSLSECRQ